MISEINRKIIEWIDRTCYSGYREYWDDKMFRETILLFLDENVKLLDVGAGRGVLKDMNFKGLAKEVHGIDPVPEIKDNPHLDYAYLGFGDDMPFFDSNTFDVVICDNVLEHITQPNKFYAEVNRVLKPGGYFISKTPNIYHYIPLVARITPFWFHKFYNSLKGREDEDSFPTKYLANTKKKQLKYGHANNFKVEEMRFIEGRPEYLRIFFFTYPFGLLYERVVNYFGIDSFKSVILTVMKKQN